MLSGTLQMYEIYINDLPMVIHHLSQTPERFEHLIVKEADDRTVFESLYDLLKNPTNGVRIPTENPEALFERFKMSLKLITAAGGVVFNPKKDILLIKRLGKWDLPKGKVEKDESIERAAIREVQEECSIYELSLGAPAGKTYHIYELKGKIVLKETHWFYMNYTGSSLPRPQKEESITDAGWFNTQTLNIETMDTYATIRGLLQQVLK